MKRSAILITGFLAAVGAGCATSAGEPTEEGAAKVLAQHERTGETEDCIGLTRIRSIRPVTEKTFLVEVGVKDYYVNDVSGRCNGATRGSTRLEYSTSLSQLCRNDIIRVVDSGAGGFITGSCGLGTYEKLRRKPDSAAETE